MEIVSGTQLVQANVPPESKLMRSSHFIVSVGGSGWTDGNQQSTVELSRSATIARQHEFQLSSQGEQATPVPLENAAIDVVYCWAGEQCAKGAQSHDSGCNNGELQWSLRSVAKYAPWVRKVHILVNGPHPKLPTFVNPNTTWIQVVDRCSLFPEANDCPTFNTWACHSVVHRIPGLSRLFLYMDDDMLITNPLTRGDLFDNEGVPRVPASKHIGLNLTSPYPVGCGPVVRPMKLNIPELRWHIPVPLDKQFLEMFEQRYPQWYAFVRSHKHRFCCDRHKYCVWPADMVDDQYPVWHAAMLQSGAGYLHSSDNWDPYCGLTSSGGLNCLQNRMDATRGHFANINNMDPSQISQVRKILEVKLGVPASFEINPEDLPTSWQQTAQLSITIFGFLVAMSIQLRQQKIDFMKVTCVLLYLILSAGDYLLVRWVSLLHDGRLPFNALRGVICVELVKLFFSVVAVLASGQLATLSEVEPHELLLLTIPAACYMLANACFLVAVSGTLISNFAFTFELQVIFISILWVGIFHRKISHARKTACIGICIGIFVQHTCSVKRIQWPSWTGSLWPAISAVSVALACVSNEYVLKKASARGLNAMNVYLCALSLLAGMLILVFVEPTHLAGRFFEGLLFPEVMLLVLLRASLGLVTSRVLKYVDAMSKTVASCLSGPLAIGLAPHFVAEPVSSSTVLASIITYASSFIYWTDPALPSRSVTSK